MRDYQLNVLNKVMSIVSGLAVSVVLARYLGVILRGELAFLTQASGMAAIVLGIGLGQAFPFFFRRSASRSTFNLFLQIFLWQAALYALVAGLIALLVHDGFVTCLLILTVTTTLYQQLEASMAAYRIRLKIWVNISLSVARVLTHVVMFIWLPVDVVWPVLLTTTLWLAAAACYVVAAGRHTAHLSLAGLKEVVSFSWVLMLSSLLVVMNYNVDTLMLKWLGTPEDLGHYAVAAGIIIYIWAIPDAVKEVLVSRVVRTNDPHAVILPLKAALVSGIAGVIALLTTGPYIIPLVFGNDFSAVAPLSAVLSIGVVSMIYYKVLGVVVLAEGNRKFYFATLAIAVAINIALNLLVIPKYGASGAAWACVVSYTATGTIFVVHFCRSKHLRAVDVLWVRLADLRSMAKMRG